MAMVRCRRRQCSERRGRALAAACRPIGGWDRLSVVEAMAAGMVAPRCSVNPCGVAGLTDVSGSRFVDVDSVENEPCCGRCTGAGRGDGPGRGHGRGRSERVGRGLRRVTTGGAGRGGRQRRRRLGPRDDEGPARVDPVGIGERSAPGLR